MCGLALSWSFCEKIVYMDYHYFVHMSGNWPSAVFDVNVAWHSSTSAGSGCNGPEFIHLNPGDFHDPICQ